MGIKLNVGASPIWSQENWHTLDHKVTDGRENSFIGDASCMPINDEACSTVFCSHMFEHIPHLKLESVLLEFNRVLERGGTVRILTPDLKKIATAYVNEDKAFFEKALSEDENIRTDLGHGGMLVNWVVSPGQDTALYNRSLTEFIGGYAHLYCYDFLMLKTLLERTGFTAVMQKEFCDSEIEDYKTPLHVKGMDPVWHNFNKKFYKDNDLVHFYDEKEGVYNINFSVTGFDRDPLTSLIIEAKKDKSISKDDYDSLNNSASNYNRYSRSLLRDPVFNSKNQAAINAAKSINE